VPGVSSAVAPCTDTWFSVSVLPDGIGTLPGAGEPIVNVAVWLPMPPEISDVLDGPLTTSEGWEKKVKPDGSVTVKRELTSSDVVVAPLFVTV